MITAEVDGWFKSNGLPLTEAAKAGIIEVGATCVEYIKLVPDDVFNSWFNDAKLVIKRSASIVFATLKEVPFDPKKTVRDMNLHDDGLSTPTPRPPAKKLKPNHLPNNNTKVLAATNTQLATDEEDINITTLPEWAIREIIDYIPKTSRALLALALTTDSASWRDIHWNKSAPKSILSWFRKGPTSSKQPKKPSAITKVILSPKNEEEENLWEEIDFKDIDYDLCLDLTDDDIAGILACVNAVQKTKRLYLHWCESITGRALEPLRGSVVLEQLDLIDYGYLQETEVIPILDSIIGRENHSLKYIQFPRNWRKGRDDGYLSRFLQRYNETEQQQSILCKNCGSNCREHLSIFDAEHRKYFGIQANTCYDCLSHYCYNCKDEEGRFYLTFCVLCEKFRCSNCRTMKSCHSCRQRVEGWTWPSVDHIERNNIPSMCTDCIDDDNDHQCKRCGHVFCIDCCYAEVNQCSTCHRSGCRSCIHAMCCEHVNENTNERCYTRMCGSCRFSRLLDGGEPVVQTCPHCLSDLCFEHRLSNCEEDWSGCCQGCVALIGPGLARTYRQHTAERSR